MVHIRDENCLREVGLDMFSGATVTVSASTNLEVKGAVDPERGGGCHERVVSENYKTTKRTHSIC
jgi:hypothetical protein